MAPLGLCFLPAFVCLGVVPDARDRAAVATMMAACFPSLLREEIDLTVGVTT